MADPLTERARATAAPGASSTDNAHVRPEDFRQHFSEDLRSVLDLSSWNPNDLGREYARIEREVREAVQEESAYHDHIRDRVFHEIGNPATAPKGGGVFRAKRELIERAHRGLLFNGGVTACDGTVQTHDTLPLTIYQIGVSLVSYRGDQGSWCQRLFRRDLRRAGEDPVTAVETLLKKRGERGALNRPTAQDSLGEMAQRTIMAYAERAILLRNAKSVWLMGHGNPVPYELLTGAGCFELMVASSRILREMIVEHQKFVFVASEPRERLLLTIGQALPPWHYAIVCTLKDRVETWNLRERFAIHVQDEAEWDGKPLKAKHWVPRFLDEVASKVVVGVYRASPIAPPQVFYAHEDHADLAAHLVLADSALQEQRGFPLLIDLAHYLCGAVFAGTLQSLTETAYAAAGTPWRYESERTTRDRP